jgi:hypothetical protein
MKKMASTKLTAYLAIAPPYQWQSDLFQEMLYEALDELCLLSGRLEFPFEEYGTYYPAIELLQRNRKGKSELKDLFPKKDVDICEVLKISVEVPLPVKPLSWVSEEHLKKPARLKSYYLLLIQKLFEKRVYDLLVIANIARVGSLDLYNNCFFQDGRKSKSLYKHQAFHLRMAATHSEKISWPKFQRLEIDHAWNWALQQKGFLEGFSEDATSRSLNAFTNILNLKDEPLILFWAIVGIEALYVRGRDPKMEQIRERTQVLLGEQISFKKKVSEMYNFRSSLIHGDLNFSGLYQLYDATPEIEKYDKALIESTDLAVAVLSATLQQLISRNWKGLRFSYLVEDMNPES